jgi:hypothetical protein
VCCEPPHPSAEALTLIGWPGGGGACFLGSDDITELSTYSQLHDWRESAVKKGDVTWVAKVPDQVRSSDSHSCRHL